jgi:Fe-S-cluster containining protein
MDMREKAAAVGSVFEELDAAIAQFQSWSGLHCKNGCGKCCFKPDIEATALEFLPFAQYLYDQGQALDWHEKLSDTADPLCVILNPTQAGAGLCSEYPHRGLICRLFGYSARVNKYGGRELVTCQVITQKIEGGAEIPVLSHYYMKLHAVDPDLAREFYPINQAIKRALETVLQYYAYRE